VDNERGENVENLLIKLLNAAEDLVEHLSRMEDGKWLINKPGQDLVEAINKVKLAGW